MKYVIVQGDGMADWPVDELGGKTPLEYARTPHMDRLASEGVFGLTRTIPDGYPPGSDVGTLSVLGYDPRRYHTGRSPIEAASMGVELAPDDVAFRCNLVSLGHGDAGAETMVDFAAGHIPSADAAELIHSLQRELGGGEFAFYPGVSYRHLLVWRGGKEGMTTTPPHDITGRPIADSLPQGEGAEPLNALMQRSREIFVAHPVNARRAADGHVRVSSIWLWGQGRQPAVPTLADRFGVSGAVISAVDLVRGVGVLAGLDVIEVPGATGFLDTNYRGKAEYGLAALREKDLLFLHVEAPDEAGHMGAADKKVQAIEDFDEKVVGTLLDGLPAFGDWRMLVMPDHATPVAIKTHSDDLVPFAALGSHDAQSGTPPAGSGDRGYNEPSAQATNVRVPEAWSLLDGLIRGDLAHRARSSREGKETPSS